MLLALLIIFETDKPNNQNHSNQVTVPTTQYSQPVRTPPKRLRTMADIKKSKTQAYQQTSMMINNGHTQNNLNHPWNTSTTRYTAATMTTNTKTSEASTTATMTTTNNN